MKRQVLIAAVVVALGVYGGVLAYQSAAVKTTILAGLATVLGCNLLVCVWLWFRAAPDSGDALVMPVVALALASMLLGILPRLFWPAADAIHVAGSIASVIVPGVMLIMQIRRRRALRRNARPV